MTTMITSKILTIPGIRHAFFTREDGVSSGLYATLNGGQGSNDAPEAVVENRRRMASALCVPPGNFISCYQIHSPDVVTVTKPWLPDQRPRADGMVTRAKGIALAIGTADCGPVLFADQQEGVIGACHAGWKGAVSGILEETIGAMEALGSQRRNINVVLGPTISQKAYEVGPEFVERFLAQDSAFSRFFIPSDKAGFSMFNLPHFIGYRLELAKIGIFEDLALCTYLDEHRFFSYRRTTHRREPDYGRLIAAIAITDE